MKNLKRKITIVCAAFGILLFSNSVKAQTNYTINNGGNYFMCDGSTYNLNLNIPSGSIVQANGWNWNGNTYTGAPDYPDNITITGWAYSNYQANITCDAGVIATGSIPVTVSYTNGGNNYNLSFTLYTWYAVISGTANVCESSSPFTYSATTNVTSPTYTWTNTASCWTATSGTTSSTVTYSTSTTCAGKLTLVVSGDGCPDNSGTTNAVNVADGSNPAEVPVGVIGWNRVGGSSCQYNAEIAAVPGAVSYDWSENGTTVFQTTTTNVTTGGDFDYSTLYHLWVRETGPCSDTPSHWSVEHSQTTPGKPVGCAEAPIKLNSQAIVPTDFKFYPNPANNSLSIEYPATSDNTSITCDMYDMVGHKLASWTLPNSDTKVTEDVSSLQTGAYLYVVHSGDTVLSRGKLMIQK